MTLWFERKKEGKKTKIWKPTDAWVTIKTVETTKVVVVVAAAFFFHGAVLLFSLCFSLKLRAADFVFRLKIEARRRARSLTVCTKKSRAGEQALNVLPGRQTAARMEGMNTQLHSSKRVCVCELSFYPLRLCVCTIGNWCTAAQGSHSHCAVSDVHTCVLISLLLCWLMTNSGNGIYVLSLFA